MQYHKMYLKYSDKKRVHLKQLKQLKIDLKSISEWIMVIDKNILDNLQIVCNLESTSLLNR